MNDLLQINALCKDVLPLDQEAAEVVDLQCEAMPSLHGPVLLIKLENVLHSQSSRDSSN